MNSKSNFKSCFLLLVILIPCSLTLLNCGPRGIGGPFIRQVKNDFNGDGIADMLIGANGEDSGGDAAGAAYLVFGSASLASSINALSANVKLIGEAAGDALGFSVTGGDVNGDGIADMIVGAYQEDTGGGAAGAVYIFYGSSSLASSIDASAANVKLIGEVAGDQFGFSVTSADINNDGFDDVIVAAPTEDTGGGAAGAVYIFYGSSSLVSSIDASSANVKIIGEDASDNFGFNISTGDINNDGFGDVIAGAPGDDDGGGGAGAVDVFYGSASLASSIDASSANVKIIGEVASDQLGQTTSSGDVNNDGFGDIFAGAPVEDSVGANAGAVYIVYGSAVLSGSIDASVANVKLTGEAAGDQFGAGPSSGDINNDGFSDIIIGANLENSGGSDAGATYIFYGSTSLASSISAANANIKFIGESAEDHLGLSNSGIADINNDGFDDLLSGAPQVVSATTGLSYVLYGAASLAASIDASAANVKLTGEAAGDQFGRSVVE